MRVLGPGSRNMSEYSTGRRRSIWLRVLFALLVAAFSLFTYFSQSEFNPVTQEKQHISLTTKDEVNMGLLAVPDMEAQYGGQSPNSADQALVNKVGARLVNSTAANTTPYKFTFHVLNDDRIINAFALPGGPVYITSGLLHRLKTEGEVAAVLSHEISHVVARHSAEHLAKQKLTEGLTGAAVIATYDPENPSTRNTAAIAALVGSLVNMKFGRQDELESDRLGVRFMSEAGYDPNSMVDLMKVLSEAGKRGSPEFLSTHPDPDNRTTRINELIAERYPNGVPDNLQK